MSVILLEVISMKELITTLFIVLLQLEVSIYNK